MRLVMIAAAVLGLGAPGGDDRAAPPTAAELAAVDALLPPARRSSAPSAQEAASCVRTCRASAKQEHGVCKNAFPGDKDICRIVREQRLAECPSMCGAGSAR